jgi:predicted deacylase
VGTATAAPGHRANGTIDVPAGRDPGTQIPVVVFRGARPGPVLALVAGLHGTEYASVLALYSLLPRIDPKELQGTLVVLPLVNLPSFEQMVPHVNPVDRKSMNRFYPGTMEGTQTDRASFLITEQVVDKCDALIDLHGGDLDESLRPYTYWFGGGDPETSKRAKEMAVNFGLDHIILWEDAPKEKAQSKYLVSTALLRGKPAIAAEAGYAGTTESEDVEVLVQGCLSVMRSLKMLPGAPSPAEHPVWLQKAVSVPSEVTGLFFPLVKRSSYVQAGTKVGYVTDYFGATIAEIRSPVAGIVLHIRPVPSLKAGDTIIDVGVIATP